MIGVIASNGETTWSRITIAKTHEPGISSQPLMMITVTDVTAERRALAEAKGVADIAGRVDVHVYRGIIDRASNRFHETYANLAIAHCLGGPLPQGADQDALWRQLIHPEDLQHLDRLHRRCALGHDTEVTYRLIGLDGETRWFLDRAHVVSVTEASTSIEGTVTNISKHKRAEHELSSALSSARRAARTDSLTGLLERRFLLEQLTDVLQVAVWTRQDVGLLMLDLDGFKRINDSFGNVFGDIVLRQLAKVISETVGPGRLSSRWGGEEFVVVVPGCAGPHELRTLAETLRRAIADEPHEVDSIRVTASIGAALASQSGARGPEALLQGAETALAATKRTGRNRVLLATDSATLVPLTAAPDLNDVARALAGAASLREGVSDEHMTEVALLSAEIARRLHLDQETEARTRLGAWLHDVGKVAVSESILLKPGPLDAAETEAMRRHAELGADFIKGLPGLQVAERGVRYHHEAWDGSGYPEGLNATRIPIEARIIAAADTFSAVTQDRCYQAGRSPELAAAELIGDAGSRLDPAVVGVLIQILVDTGRIDASCSAVLQSHGELASISG